MVAALVDAQLVTGAGRRQRGIEHTAVLGIDQQVGRAVLKEERRSVRPYVVDRLGVGGIVIGPEGRSPAPFAKWREVERAGQQHAGADGVGAKLHRAQPTRVERQHRAI
jgi:hypothetical protein